MTVIADTSIQDFPRYRQTCRRLRIFAQDSSASRAGASERRQPVTACDSPAPRHRVPNSKATSATFAPFRNFPITIATSFVCLFLTISGYSSAQDLRFVPQLDLTDFRPKMVLFNPKSSSELMVVNTNGRIDILDVTDPTAPIKTFETHGGAHSAVFLDDEGSIVSGGLNSLEVWNTESGTRTTSTPVDHGPITSLAYTNHGKRIASAGIHGTVQIWDADTMQRLAGPLEGHVGQVNSLAFSANGRFLASAGDDRIVRFWNLETQEQFHEPLQGHIHRVNAVAFSPDGRRFASAGNDGNIMLWSTEKSQPVFLKSLRHGRWAKSVAFSPDSTFLATGGDYRVRLWYATDGAAAGRALSGHNVSDIDVAFSPNGRVLASVGDDRALRLWRLEPISETVCPTKQHNDHTYSVAVSETFQLVASGDEGGLARLWDVSTELPTEVLTLNHGSAIRTIAFSKSSRRVATGGDDKIIRLWNATTGDRLGNGLKGEDEKVVSLAFSPTDANLLLSGGNNGTVELWDLTYERKLLQKSIGEMQSVDFVAFSPDGDIFGSSGTDGNVRLWRLDNGEPVLLLPAYKGHAMTTFTFNSDGTRVATGGDDGVVRLWSAETGLQLAASMHPHSNRILDIEFSPDDTRIASTSLDGTIRLWDSKNLMRISASAKAHESYANRIAFYSNGKRIASVGPDGRLRLWDLETPVPIRAPIMGQAEQHTEFSISPNGSNFVTSSANGKILLGAFGHDAPILTHIENLPGDPHTLAISQNGEFVASARPDSKIQLWDGSTKGIRLFEQNGHTSKVYDIAFSADAKFIASASMDKTVRLWEVATGEQWATLIEPLDEQIVSLAIDTTGSLLVSGLANGMLRLWDTQQKQSRFLFDMVPENLRPKDDQTEFSRSAVARLAQIRRRESLHLYIPFGIAFSPDGTQLAVTGRGFLSLMHVTKDHIRPTGTTALACASKSISWTHDHVIIAKCEDRISFHDSELTSLGQIFFVGDSGFIGISRELGMFASPQKLKDNVLTFAKSNNLGAADLVPAQEINAVLFNKWTMWNGFRMRVQHAIGHIVDFHVSVSQSLGKGVYAFWMFVFWTIMFIGAVFMWLLFPTKLAWWAMPRFTPNPGMKQIVSSVRFLHAISLFVWLGHTRRPVMKWLEQQRGALEHKCFSSVKQVSDRSRFYSPDHSNVDEFRRKIQRSEHGLYWISGVGGKGKSALGMHMIRECTVGRGSGPVPVFVDEEWGESLAEYVADRFFDEEKRRGPTRNMIAVLGENGLICPLIDSVSERRRVDATEQLENILQKKQFRYVLVTSRSELPSKDVWRSVKEISPTEISRGDLREFVSVYAEQNGADVVEEVSTLIDSLLKRYDMPSPLFLRFAVEQAMEGKLKDLDPLSLIKKYLEGLRKNEPTIEQFDMVRAASIAAIASVRERMHPIAIPEERLRTELDAAGDEQAFVGADRKTKLTSAELVDILVRSGVVFRVSDRIQFTYDPVAEYLAAERIRTDPAGNLLGLGIRASESKDTPVGRAYQRIG